MSLPRHLFYAAAALALTACGSDSPGDFMKETRFELSLNAGADLTNELEVVVQLSYLEGFMPPGGVEMAIWSGPAPSELPWQPYAQASTITLSGEEGAHRVSAKLRAPSSFSESGIVTETIVLDTTPPSIAFVTPWDGQVLSPAGLMAEMAVTDANGASGLTLTVDDAEPVPAEPTGGDTFSVALQLEEGTHTLVASAEDSAGNTAQATVTVVVDAQAPLIAITSPANGSALNTPDVEIVGTVDDVSVDRVTVTVGAVEHVVDVIDGGFTTPITLEPGVNTIIARGTDGAGQEGASGALTLTLDQAAPTGVDLLIGDGAAVVGSPSVDLHLSFVDDGPVAVQIGDGGGGTPSWLPATPLFPGWQLSDPEVEGDKTVTARYRDSAGNVSELIERHVVLDLFPPDLEVIEPTQGTTTQAPTVALSGTVADASEVTLALTVNGKPFPLEVTAGAFQAEVPLKKLVNLLSIEAVDALGRKTTWGPTSVTFDETLAILSPLPTTITGLSTIPVVVSSTDASVTSVDLLVNGVKAGVATPDPEGDNLVGEVPLEPGQNTITAQAQLSGGKLAYSAPVTIVSDLSPPTGVELLVNEVDGVGATSIASLDVTLSLYAEDVSGVMMRVSNSPNLSALEWVPWEESFAWTMQDNGTGVVTVYAEVIDEWGNGPVAVQTSVLYQP